MCKREFCVKIYFMKIRNLSFVAAFAVLGLVVACSRKNGDEAFKKLPNTVVLEWNEIAYQAFGGTTYQHSLMASRINAMTQIAIHDAINAVYPVYATYKFNGKDEKADPIAAAASAAHAVLLHEIPTKKNYLN